MGKLSLTTEKNKQTNKQNIAIYLNEYISFSSMIIYNAYRTTVFRLLLEVIISENLLPK